MDTADKSHRRIGVIVQARLASTRFPRKIFEDVNGTSILRRVIMTCVHYWSCADVVIVAVPRDEANEFYSHISDMLINAAGKIVIARGSPDDVLDRFATAGAQHGLDIVVRVTADCPLVRPENIRRALDFFTSNDYDYINNSTITRVLSVDVPDDYRSDTSTPDGMNVEIFTMDALERAAACATDAYDREHVTPWMKRNLRCAVVDTGSLWHAYEGTRADVGEKLSVDTRDDLDHVRKIAKLIDDGVLIMG